MTPNTMVFSGAVLEKMKNEGPVSDGVLKSLKNRAEERLLCPVRATVYRKSKAPSGDIHDFSSIGPYWWPDPEKPDGLPYIRRDGEINPEFPDENDIRDVCDAVFELSLAAYYFESKKYADRAVKFIYDWFLSPETYMNPHLEYAQAIPGICNGRGIGIIDFGRMNEIFDGIAILESLGFIDENLVKDFRTWVSRFTDWLLTSENAIEEDCEPNNHGTYFEALMLSCAIFTGRTAIIKRSLMTAYDRRLVSQVEFDGRQPWELARTAAMHYSMTNIKAFMLIASMAAHCGDNRFWEADKERGVSIIKSAVDYIYPFVLEPETFPYSELMPNTLPDMGARMLMWADARFEGEGYEKHARALLERLENREPWWLAIPFK